jgi:hypothetical protein
MFFPGSEGGTGFRMKKPIQNQASPLVGRIVYQDRGFPRFYLIMKETLHTVTLKPIQSIQTLAQPAIIYGQRGTEVPAIDQTPPEWSNPKYLRRAKKHESDYAGDHLWFSHKNSAFFLWDGKPVSFDDM